MGFVEFIKPNTSIDFLRPSKFLMAVSGLLVVGAILLMIFKGFNYGIEFTGGVELRLEFQQGVTIDQIRGTFEKAGLAGVDVVHFKIEGKNVFSVKIKGDVAEKISARRSTEQGGGLPALVTEIQAILNKELGEGRYSIVSTDMIGARVGKDLRQKAVYAILLSNLGILAYLAYRFNVRYSPGAVVALIHDVAIVAGAFALTGREINLTAVAALLTIAGYSVNDTIVIFDRIREGHKIYRNMTLPELVNRCVNDTFSRTLLTNFTVLLVVVSMHVLGSEIIKDFTFAMLIGCFVGTYSTLYIASPIYIWLETMSQKRRKVVARKK